MWTIEEALTQVFLELQHPANEVHYYLALAGGVLNHGSSNHDLDIIAMPRIVGANPKRLLEIFQDKYKMTFDGRTETDWKLPSSTWFQFETPDKKIIELGIVNS